MDISNVQVVQGEATTASTQKPPLLGLELQVSDGTKITCKTDLDSIVPRMLAVFDKAITVTQVLMCVQMPPYGVPLQTCSCPFFPLTGNSLSPWIYIPN